MTISFSKLKWVLVPLGMFAIVECCARATLTPQWYSALNARSTSETAQALFVGRSRVGAAVDVAAFQSKYSALTGKTIACANLGIGHATIHQHALGVKRWVEANRVEAPRVVFLEAPGGLVDTREWQQAWVDSEMPQHLLSVLGWREVSSFFASSTARKLKIEIVGRKLLQPSVLLSRRERVRSQLMHSGKRSIIAIFESVLSERHLGTAKRPSAEPLRAGGTKVLRGWHLEQARRSARLQSERLLENQVPMVPLEHSVEKDLAATLSSQGGRLIVFYMPVDSFMMAPVLTELRQNDISKQRAAMDGLGMSYIRPEISVKDEDFADGWHLNPDRSAEFSEALAETFVKMMQEKRPTPDGTFSP
jgi:hypothetical protein